jgi:hypothetical protein
VLVEHHRLRRVEVGVRVEQCRRGRLRGRAGDEEGARGCEALEVGLAGVGPQREHREHLVVLGERVAGGVLLRGGRLRRVEVGLDEGDLAPVDAAGRVDLLDEDRHLHGGLGHLDARAALVVLGLLFVPGRW